HACGACVSRKNRSVETSPYQAWSHGHTRRSSSTHAMLGDTTAAASAPDTSKLRRVHAGSAGREVITGSAGPFLGNRYEHAQIRRCAQFVNDRKRVRGARGGRGVGWAEAAVARSAKAGVPTNDSS